METLTQTPAQRTALEGLVDYAGLFPPAKLPMEAAVAQYEQAKIGSAAWMLGRFIVRAEDLIALRTCLAGRARIELSVISTPEMFEVVARIRHEGWATIAAIEVPLGDYSIGGCARQARRARLDDLPIYVEPARQHLAMDKLAEHGLRAKLRCGGVKPSAFPSVTEVAAFIAAASEAGVAFKATAGLHHPVRHFNEAAGVTMHGFLNLLCAAALAPKDDRAALEAIVAEEDPSALLRVLEDEGAMRGARARFASYGSCSFDEPVEDLRALGVLAAA
ncbi:MAG: hypothetical protein WBG27_05580 [Candidatus Aquilonibacter sp.]|jgi:hypothetical protein